MQRLVFTIFLILLPALSHSTPFLVAAPTPCVYWDITGNSLSTVYQCVTLPARCDVVELSIPKNSAISNTHTAGYISGMSYKYSITGSFNPTYPDIIDDDGFSSFLFFYGKTTPAYLTFSTTVNAVGRLKMRAHKCIK